MHVLLSLRSLLAAALLALTVVACGGDSADQAQTSVVYTDKADPEMNGAISQARAELDEFVKAVTSPAPTQTKFGAKVAIPHAGGAEHIWLAQPMFEADSIVGIVEAAPLYLKGIAAGDRVRVDRDAISDWMYLDNGKLRGGYTVRVAIDRLPEDQRAAQRAAYGLE